MTGVGLGAAVTGLVILVTQKRGPARRRRPRGAARVTERSHHRPRSGCILRRWMASWGPPFASKTSGEGGAHRVDSGSRRTGHRSGWLPSTPSLVAVMWIETGNEVVRQHGKLLGFHRWWGVTTYQARGAGAAHRVGVSNLVATSSASIILSSPRSSCGWVSPSRRSSSSACSCLTTTPKSSRPSFARPSARAAAPAPA